MLKLKLRVVGHELDSEPGAVATGCCRSTDEEGHVNRLVELQDPVATAPGSVIEWHSRTTRFLRSALAITLAAMALLGCSCGAGSDPSAVTAAQTSGGASLTQEDKHRLYSAALAASDSPLDTAIFKDVCKQIGIFDADGNPNGGYLAFVQQHVQWGMKTEANEFRQEINTKEKAEEYVLKHIHGSYQEAYR